MPVQFAVQIVRMNTTAFCAIFAISGATLIVYVVKRKLKCYTATTTSWSSTAHLVLRLRVY